MVRSWHLFGNDGRRYRTLEHSPDVDPALAGALERFSWGQARKADYLGTLAREPALWVQPLPGGRHAITRVLRGEQDDAGRWSQAFLTLVVPTEEWARSIATSLRTFCADGRTWRVTDRLSIPDGPPAPRTRSGTASPLGPGAVAPLLRRVLDDGDVLVVEPELLTLADCEEVFRLLSEAERARCGFAYRAVSDALPATLCVLDPLFVTRPAPLGRTVLRRGGAVDRQPSTVPPPDSRGAAGRPANGSASVPAVTRTPFDDGGDAALPESPPRMIMSRPVAVAFAALLLLLLVNVVTTFRGVGSARASAEADTLPADEKERQDAALQDDFLKRVRGVVEVNVDAGVRTLSGRLDAFEGRLTGVETQMTTLREKLEEIASSGARQDALDALSNTSTSRLDQHAKALDAVAKSIGELSTALADARADTEARFGSGDRVLEEQKQMLGSLMKRVEEWQDELAKQWGDLDKKWSSGSGKKKP